MGHSYSYKSLEELLAWLVQSESSRRRVCTKVVENNIVQFSEFVRIGEIKRELNDTQINRNQAKYITLLLSAFCGSQMDNSTLFNTLVDFKKELRDRYSVRLEVRGDTKIFQLSIFSLIHYKKQSDIEGWTNFTEEVSSILPEEITQLIHSIPSEFFSQSPEEGVLEDIIDLSQYAI